MKTLMDLLVLPIAILFWVACDWPLSSGLQWVTDLDTGWKAVILFIFIVLAVIYVGLMALLPMIIAGSRVWGAWCTAVVQVLLRLSTALFLIGTGDSWAYVACLALACAITAWVAFKRLTSHAASNAPSEASSLSSSGPSSWQRPS